MSSLYAKGNAVIPMTPSATHVDKEGYLVTTDTGEAVLSASATVPATGVILEGAATSGKDSIGILGGLEGPVFLRAGGAIGLGDEVQQHTDGTVLTDAGSGSRVIVGVALEAAVATQLFRAVAHKGVARS